MARITVEDCLQKVDNRFALIHLAAKRVRSLRKGSEPLVECKNEDIVVSLREIAEGFVTQAKEPKDALLPEQTEAVETMPEPSPADSETPAIDAAEAAPEAAEEEKS